MKLQIVLRASLVLLVSGVCTLAAEPVSSQVKSSTPVQAPQRAKVKAVQIRHRDTITATGSHLKRDANKATISASPLYILDSDTIRNSGAVNVYELLTRRGVRR